MAGILIGDVVSRWIILTLINLLLGVLCDGVAWATTAWGYGEGDNFYTTFGLWQICNGTRELSADKKELFRGEPECVFPTQVNFDWIPKALVMEIMAGFCSTGIFISLFIYFICLKLDMMKSRNVMVAMIPMALLSALFNFIGLLIISTNMSDLKTSPSYSVAFDALASFFFASATVFGTLDMQGCCQPENRPQPVPVVVKGLTRPI